MILLSHDYKYYSSRTRSRSGRNLVVLSSCEIAFRITSLSTKVSLRFCPNIIYSRGLFKFLSSKFRYLLGIDHESTATGERHEQDESDVEMFREGYPVSCDRNVIFVPLI